LKFNQQQPEQLRQLVVETKRVYFVLLSIFRNFGFAELTWHSEMERKTSFPF